MIEVVKAFRASDGRLFETEDAARQHNYCIAREAAVKEIIEVFKNGQRSFGGYDWNAAYAIVEKATEICEILSKCLPDKVIE